LAIRYRNGGAKEASTDRFEANKLVVVNAKSKQKHLPIKDANNQFVAGPIGDAIGGGRIYVKLQPGQEAIAWAYFDAIDPGTVVSVEVPQMFPFEDVPVTDGLGNLLKAGSARSTPHGALASLVSAKRADEVLKARLKLAAEPDMPVQLRSPYFEYKDVYLFDPVNKRRYPLLKGADGLFQASPTRAGANDFLPHWDAPILMSLAFQSPPDSVAAVDLVLPDFLPFENVAIEGLGGATNGGIAAAGKTLGLEGALKELAAEVSPDEIKIDLAADVLFDFDKSDLKPAAEVQLNHLLTVVNSRPDAQVAIEGHTDVRGDAAYNQALSQRRAESVRAWLTQHGVAANRLAATGAGESRPLNTGSTEADHQANRRVEIRIRQAHLSATVAAPASSADVTLEPGNWRVQVTSSTNGNPDPAQDAEQCIHPDEVSNLDNYFAPILEDAKADCRRSREPSTNPRILNYEMHCVGAGFTQDMVASVTIDSPRQFRMTIRMQTRTPSESALVLAQSEANWLGACLSPEDTG
jgi:outer membrane protein OmpA-like peptidoglycan-associated protein